MIKSTHKAEVVPVVLETHPNADALSIVRVFGYTVVVNTEQWKGIDKAVYVVPDSLVDCTRPEFSFLNPNPEIKIEYFSGVPVERMVRVKVKKLRGVVSMGLLIPAPPESKIGDNLAEFYGIERYEPPLDLTTGGDCVSGPKWQYSPSKYDIDSYHRYLHLFEDGEPVYITEKIHGANGRFSYMSEFIETNSPKGMQYCGSRTQWKKESPSDIWWRAYHNTPGIAKFCEAHEGLILWGEVYGQVQNLKYGLTDVHFAAFDIFDVMGGKFLDPCFFMAFCREYGVPMVPVIHYSWIMDKSKVLEFAEGKSLIADHVREGCVIKPMKERYTEEVGRLALKIVGNGYYEKVK